MASKRRIGAALGDSSKPADKLITDFRGHPTRLKRQKTEDLNLDSATGPKQTTMASSLAESSWEDKPSLADLNLFSQEEHTWEIRPGKKNQQKSRGKAANTPHFHSLPEKTTLEPKTRHLVLAYEKGDLFDAPPNSVLIHACNTIGRWGGGIAATFKKHYPAAFEVYRDHCKKFTPDELIGTALLIAPQSDKYWPLKDDEVELAEAKRKDSKANDTGITTPNDDSHDPEADGPKTTTQDGWFRIPKCSKAPQDGSHQREQRYDWAKRDDPGGDYDYDPQPPSHNHEKDIHYIACLFTSKNIGAKRDAPEMILKHTESAMKNLLLNLSGVKFNPEVRMCMINSGLFGVPWESTSELLDGMKLSELLDGIKLSRFQTWGREVFKVIVVSKEDGPEEEGKKVLGESNISSTRRTQYRFGYSRRGRGRS
ncbi:hypothetical protein QBC36DRAFT_359834 [Triangularia setosa]|uniref:ADP-ribose 1''-phosphate phosphatase n=1 Tax=Triangularia setosa TaxID=2587417 RepID=A0AAN7A301_9PEZI|nr:hypothetical protein QBC36DRAFT_359834 [Podospora setosa]